MGWENTCAQRPGQAAAPPPIEHGASSAALLEPVVSKAERLAEEEAAKPWSVRKHFGVGALFIGGLWLTCFLLTWMLIHALLRVTAD